MNRGDSGSCDPRTREVSNKPANGMWDRNKMRYSALCVHCSFGAWTRGCFIYSGVFWWFQNVTGQSNEIKILHGLPSTEDLLGCHRALQGDSGALGKMRSGWAGTAIFVFLL